MSKKVIFGEEARKKLIDGVNIVANAVKVTLGPRGKMAVFNRGVGPVFSMDGVTVAKHIQLKDEAEDNGAQLVIGVARETDKSAGDGTTTATVLVQSILKQGIKALSSGIDHTKMKKGIDRSLSVVKSFIKDNANKIKNESELSDIATISSRDRDIGDIVAKLVHKLGKDAIITVEDSKVLGLYDEIVDGVQIDKGFISPYFMTNQERGEAVLDNPFILVTSQAISTNQDIFNILNEVYKSDSRSLFIIAESIRGEALATLVMNKIQGRLNICAIQAPGMGEDKIEQLKDFCAITNATFISEEIGTKTEDVELSQLGKADRVIVNKDKSIIVGGKGNIKDRIKQIQSEIDKETRDFNREQRELRVGKLKGGVAVIKVGSYSEEESVEKRYRIEDAIRAAKSSLEEGIVVGAGMTLFNASKLLEEELKKENDISTRTGITIIKDAIQEPARQIITNAGYNPDVILSKGEGFNSATGEYVDLFKEGIIDPAKVVRVGIENAVSIASLFLTSECVIVEDPDDKKDSEQSYNTI